MILLENYEKAKQELYAHVGFEEDFVVCPIDICIDMVWDVCVDAGIVRFAENKSDLFDEDAGKYYEDELYTQRFYSKWVYEGKDFTMIMCNPSTDGMQWFRIFDNNKRFKVI